MYDVPALNPEIVKVPEVVFILLWAVTHEVPLFKLYLTALQFSEVVQLTEKLVSLFLLNVNTGSELKCLGIVGKVKVPSKVAPPTPSQEV